jgi:type II secretory pathway pseudopilin PulG
MHMSGEVVKKPRRVRGNRGLTLVETMLSVAIGLIVLVAAMKIYPTIERNKQEQLALEGLHQLNANLVKAFSTQGNFNGISNQIAIKMGLVPDMFVTDAQSGKILGPWSGIGDAPGGGNVDLTIDPNPHLFDIWYYNLPLDVCYHLVSNFFPQNLVYVGRGSTTDGVFVNSQTKQDALSLAKKICGDQDPVPPFYWALKL